MGCLLLSLLAEAEVVFLDWRVVVGMVQFVLSEGVIFERLVLQCVVLVYYLSCRSLEYLSCSVYYSLFSVYYLCITCLVVVWNTCLAVCITRCSACITCLPEQAVTRQQVLKVKSCEEKL